MLEHPDEDSIRSRVESALRAEFDLARRVFRYWQRARLNDYAAKSALPAVVLHAALSLNTKALRQFRTVVDLCQRAEASDADTVSRALFETLLATGFVMRPCLYLAVEPLGGANNPRTNTKGRIRYRAVLVKKCRQNRSPVLSRVKRAGMFVVGSYLQDHILAKKAKEQPGAKRIGAFFDRLVPESILVEAEQKIGWECLSAIIEKGNYSGVDISTLAKLVGLNTYYQSVYRVQSRSVHASEANRHVDFQGDACLRAWWSSIPEVRATLLIAVGLFLSTLIVVSKEVPLGEVVATVISGFLDELRAIWPEAGAVRDI